MDNKLNGKGSIKNNQEIYEGSFQNGKYHGFGNLKYKDGRKYAGYFK